MNTDNSSSFRFNRLRGHFANRVVDRIERIERELERGRQDPGDGGTDWSEIFRIVHKLAGSAGTFGYPSVSERSKEVEQRLGSVLDGPAAVDETFVETLEQYCREVRREVRARSRDDVDGHGLEDGGEPDGRTVVFIFDDDADLGDELVSQLRAYGYEVVLYQDPGRLLAAVEDRRPDVVLMDVVFASGRWAGIRATEQLRASSYSDIPVIFVSSNSGMRTRLRAVRAGGEDYFVKPIEPSLLVERIAEITGRRDNVDGHVLLVDDDDLLCEYLSGVLRDRGFEVTVLYDSLKILEVIRDNPPDLLLLDLYLPDYTGDELAAVLRQHEIDVGIPIVFISTESDPKRQTRALMRGGDAFLFKPIEPDQLIDTVRFHLFRGQRIRRRIHIDGLTKLYNHGYLKDHLEREVGMTDRNGTTLSLAILDLDDFKEINDEWGHQVGDAVLRMIANLLRTRLRSTDIVGRYGGEEFAVILPDTDADGAWQVMDELREAFSGLEYRIGDESVTGTFTFGIATAEDGSPSADRLWKIADEALYEGKRSGKNRGVIGTGSD